MTITQQLNQVIENSYDDEITITGIAPGHFPAVISNAFNGSNPREIQVSIMPLEQAPGGTMSTNSGLYKRDPSETEVKVTVLEDGKELASNTQSY